MKKQTQTRTHTNTTGKKGLCDDMNFTMAESFKMLRTKLNLIIPREEEQNSRVFAVTSSVPGEGKTLTSINLAYTFAETGKNVCLVEADMRLPNINRRLGLNATPGLSNFLADINNEKVSLQRYLSPRGVKFVVLTAGDVPPMPSELIESKRMGVVMTALRRTFDYVIVDLPPVMAVTDAIAFSPMADGTVMVVRKDVCDRKLLQNTLSQLQLANVRLAGIVFNAADSSARSPSSAAGKR